MKRVRELAIPKQFEERLKALSLDPETPPLTVAEAAKATNTSQEFWRSRIRNRSIEFIRIGRSVRIPLYTILITIEVVPSIQVGVK